MKLSNLLSKVSKYNLNVDEFNKIEIFSKKLKDLKLITNYINNNFIIKRSGLLNYIPLEDAYRIRIIIQNTKNSQDYTNMIESFAYNNKLKNAKINSKDFIDHPDAITVNNINEVKPLISMFNIDLNKNVFKKDSYAYFNNSNDFNDICGNYIKFVF